MAWFSSTVAELVDPLDANERQRGLCGSSWQVRGLMLGDLGHLRAVRLLPFAAAALPQL